MNKLLTTLVALTALAAGAIWSAPLGAEPQARPLLMEGKRSLFQRVLAKPGATLHEAPGKSKAQGKPVTPFTAFYVYARKTDDGQTWVQVGHDIHGGRLGWIPSSETLEWNQGLTLSFRDPKGGDRVLLFRDRESLKAIVDAKDKSVYEKLYKAVVEGKHTADSGVIAIQPDRHIDILKDFYLVPISKHEDVYLGAEQARMLEVATAPLRTDEPVGNDAFRGGLTFVVDTTLSMQPYIERTREAVRKIFKRLSEDKANGRMRFGLVAYRDDPKAVEGVEYLTRTFATLQDGVSAETFLPKVREVKASPVSTREFSEDAYAGIKQAIEGMDWNGLASRYLVLITDAGARDPGNPNASTGLDAASLNKLAQQKGIAIAVLHLLTPEGADNHASATAQYKTLSNYPGIGELYYGVDTGDVAKFGRVLDALTAQISAQTQKSGAAGELGKTDTDDAQLKQLQSRIAKLGYALRMQYLAKSEGSSLPNTFNAWLLDRDFRKPERSTLEVRVLLTRDQLSDLHDTMRRLLQTFEDGLISPRGFLEELKSLAATVSRDPKRLGEATRAGSGANLIDLGFMQEYVEDLPYRGEIMNVSLEDWESWPPKRQIELIHRLEEKIAYYKTVHDHTDLWVSLDGGPVSGNSVFPLELEMLP